MPWRGSATFQRLDNLCRGILDGLAPILAHGHPIVLVGDSDVGGLIGIHFCEEMKVTTPIVSIDGLELKDFDYIDIGSMLETTGAVQVAVHRLRKRYRDLLREHISQTVETDREVDEEIRDLFKAVRA